MILPVDIVSEPRFRLYRDAMTKFSADIIRANPEKPGKDEEVQQTQDATRAMLNSALSYAGGLGGLRRPRHASIDVLTIIENSISVYSTQLRPPGPLILTSGVNA